MKRLFIVLCLAGGFVPAQARNPHAPAPRFHEAPAKSTVQAFFAAFGKGDLEALVQTFDPAAEITAVRAGNRAAGQIYGSYKGHAGVREFVAGLGAAFQTQAFTVEQVIGEGETVFASGKFTHLVKATGKTFSSDWALKCTVRNGKIVSYHFYEDSAAYAQASGA
ncbi:nuclear transport factor 2 family protein [Chitinophaga caseinilytica]|uniref:nuclear transport factor 2 family protein n=1 Tax=Chitinophaga caseinilytica TaxID=2267521 RepID=UPI003C2ACB5A